MKGERLARVNRLVQITLADLVPQLVKDPRVTRPAVLSITAVRVSPDLRQAKVYLSVTGEPAERQDALEGLRHARGFLRGELGRAVRLRYTPELIFLLDETIESAARIEGILKELADGSGDDGPA